MAKDTRVTFDNSSPNPSKQNGRPGRHSRTERQISYEETENCVNEMSESFPALSNRAHRLMRQVSESFNFRTIKVALIISAILNLALGIPFGVFVGIYISQKSENSSPTVGAHTASQLSAVSSSWQRGQSNYYTHPSATYNIELCIKCLDIPLERSDLWRKITIKSRNGICCTNQADRELEGKQFNLYNHNLRNQLKDPSSRIEPPYNTGSRSPSGRKYPPCSYDVRTESTAAAHMMLNVKQTKLNSNNHRNPQVDPLAWVFDNTDGAKNFLGAGVSYEEGKIVIAEAGKYHVYSQVTLDTNDNPLPGERIITFAVLINSKTKTRKDGPLLSSQITLKNAEVRSMNTEGTFQLFKGDSVSVYISHPSVLKDVPEGNSFGLFKL